MNNRIEILYAGDDFKCQISTKKNWLLLVFVPLLLSAKAKVFYTALSLTISSQELFEFMFLLFWFLLLSSLFLIIIAMWFWNAFGKEIITIDSALLTIKHDMFGLGKTKAFPVKEISNVRISEFHNMILLFSNFLFWNTNSGMIAFDFKDETFRFGIRLSEIESYKLMKKLKRYFEK